MMNKNNESIEVLIAAMNKNPYQLIKCLNISSNAIIGNQANNNEVFSFEHNSYTIKVYTFNEQGLSRNRNNALMRASSEICLLADDDIELLDDYPNILMNAFKNHKDADVIVFNIVENPIERYVIKSEFKVNHFNYMRFGSVRIAFKREKIIENGIFFNLNYGAGAKYSFGEDTLFLSQCLKAKLNVIAVPEFIAKINNNRESTWFKGYDEAYFFNKGRLFRAINKKYSKLLCLQDFIRHKKEYGDRVLNKDKIRLMFNGTKNIDLEEVKL